MMNEHGSKSISKNFFKNASEFEHFWLLAVDVVDSCHQNHVQDSHFVSTGDQTSSFQHLVNWDKSFGHDKVSNFCPPGLLFHQNA